MCVVWSASGSVRIGVAGDRRKRLRELQVGSPVKLADEPKEAQRVVLRGKIVDWCR